MRNKLKNISIKWKIFTYLIGFCILLITIIWIFQTVLLNKFYKRIKVNEVKSVATEITNDMDNNTNKFIQGIANEKDVCIEILNNDGKEIYSSNTLRECIVHRMTINQKKNLILETLDNNGERIEYYKKESYKGEVPYNKDKFFGKSPEADREMYETLIYSKTFKDNNGDNKVLVINSVISPINATVKTLKIQLYCITIFMIILSIIIALIISRRVSMPIEKLNDAAKALAKGEYDVKFNGSGYKEINELSNTLTYAAHELSKVDELRKDLIANVSHDLRTPITLISGYAEAMRDLPNENNAENAQVIIDEATRLTSLVNDVLDISKLQSKVQILNISNFNLTNEISKVVNRLNDLIRNDGYKINFIYDEEVKIKGDEVKISQAFYNLLINGINYTGEDKIIIVKQTLLYDNVKISVIDSGEGIMKENLPYIWERYYKVDKNHKRSVTGTGLGLSIVKSIIEMHNGEYGVESKINEGSTFWFTLKRIN